jgi:hypothetical protein
MKPDLSSRRRQVQGDGLFVKSGQPRTFPATEAEVQMLSKIVERRPRRQAERRTFFRGDSLGMKQPLVATAR